MNHETKFKSTLIKNLQEKGLAESSIKTYLRNLEKLNGGKPLLNFSYLKDSAHTLESLEKYKDNTKRNYLISICSCLSTDLKTKPKQKLYDTYYALMMSASKTLKAIDRNNEATETQKDNWISWDEVTEVMRKGEALLDSPPTRINAGVYNKLLGAVALACYYYKPPRRNLDYCLMKIGPDTDDAFNWYDPKTHKFIFNVFKTAKTEGQQSEDVGPELQAIISKWLKIREELPNKSDWLLPEFSGEPLNKTNGMTRVLNKIFGGNVSSSMLRHIWLSDKYGDVLKEQKADASAMAHSTATQKDYVKTNI